jgi:hypothetical protein
MKITQKMSGHQDQTPPLIILLLHFQIHLKIIQTTTTTLAIIITLIQIINLNLILRALIINHINLQNQFNRTIVILKEIQATLSMDNILKTSLVLILWLSYKGERNDRL